MIAPQLSHFPFCDHIRLVDRVYPDHDSIDDYIALLRAKEYEQAHPVRLLRSVIPRCLYSTVCLRLVYVRVLAVE